MRRRNPDYELQRPPLPRGGQQGRCREDGRSEKVRKPRFRVPQRGQAGDGAANDGELHIEVPLYNTYVECSGIALSGNLRLVTGGSGWLAMARANQTFTGGVVVAEGTAYSPNNNRFPEDKCYWGPAGGTITVMTNATFDARGNTTVRNRQARLLANRKVRSRAVQRLGLLPAVNRLRAEFLLDAEQLVVLRDAVSARH